MYIETTFSTRTMGVLERMASKIQYAPSLLYSVTTDEEYRTLQKRIEAMTSSYANVMRTLFGAPGVRVWPDNGREDCLSLAGSMEGMMFGIIFHADDADGVTGTWAFHS